MSVPSLAVWREYLYLKKMKPVEQWLFWLCILKMVLVVCSQVFFLWERAKWTYNVAHPCFLGFQLLHLKMLAMILIFFKKTYLVVEMNLWMVKTKWSYVY